MSFFDLRDLFAVPGGSEYPDDSKGDLEDTEGWGVSFRALSFEALEGREVLGGYQKSFWRL